MKSNEILAAINEAIYPLDEAAIYYKALSKGFDDPLQLASQMVSAAMEVCSPDDWVSELSWSDNLAAAIEGLTAIASRVDGDLAPYIRALQTELDYEKTESF